MISTDWATLWRELASSDIQASFEGETKMIERWRRVARQLDAGERQLQDTLLEHILRRLTPEMTVLDIGAGIGRCAVGRGSIHGRDANCIFRADQSVAIESHVEGADE